VAYLAPSILSADITRLAEQIKTVEQNGADFIHVDVMDGHFVPNLTFGPIMVKAVKQITPLPVDAHLMVNDPMKFIDWFAEAGASYITIHQEACVHLDRAVNHIKNLGCKAGVSINPATPLETIRHLLHRVDLVLIMSVNPGFGGQKFIPYTLDKISHLYQIRQEAEATFLIEVDGGINSTTATQVLQAGADVLVAGNAIFNADSIAQACAELKALTKNTGLLV
jgi:ribulose-phosphate 3-epimerase